jgi:hypothetical protein
LTSKPTTHTAGAQRMTLVPEGDAEDGVGEGSRGASLIGRPGGGGGATRQLLAAPAGPRRLRLGCGAAGGGDVATDTRGSIADSDMPNIMEGARVMAAAAAEVAPGKPTDNMASAVAPVIGGDASSRVCAVPAAGPDSG